MASTTGSTATAATADALASTSAPPSESAQTAEPKLPPLSPDQFRVYNRLAESMEYFHEHFRTMWRTLYTACENGRRPANMTMRQFLEEGIQLTRYLEMHHNIEETHIFPLLARKMPEFQTSGKAGKGKVGELVQQHKLIHAGMDAFEEYLHKCRNRETELDLRVLKEQMDSWGPVLLKHLDQEVATLGAENMRKYWTPAEVRSIPI